MRWQKLQQDFLALVIKAEGPQKYSCGKIIVSYGDPYDFDRTGISVEFGGYCIGDWARRELIGPFRTEDEAYDAAVKKVEEACEIVDSECEP